MNIQRIKGIVWVGTLLAGAYLAWSVSEVLQNKQVLAEGVSKQARLDVLNDVEEPPPPENNLVAYTEVTRVFHAMNWTGKPDPVVVAPRPEDEVLKPVKTPISQLLAVLVVKVDTGDAAGSRAVVAFTDPALKAVAKDREDHVLRVGSKLAGKHSYASVSAITAEGVEFSFEEEGREKELVPTVAFPNGGPGIVMAGAGGAILPAKSAGIRTSQNPIPYRPKETLEIAKNEWQLGYETMEGLNDDYSKILSQDVSTRPHRNPSTGRVDGIEITRVKAGSLPAAHGISEGEVLKSINGHEVTGRSDAINFVKKEADHTDTWVAVFEKRGRLITRTYHSPPPE